VNPREGGCSPVWSGRSIPGVRGSFNGRVSHPRVMACRADFGRRFRFVMRDQETLRVLWSEFSTAAATQLKLAVMQASGMRRTTVVPALLNAWAAYRVLARSPF
jgi:hypothetical protein